MHLIDTRTLQLQTFPSEKGLRYAILSHRWLQSPLEEVLFEDMPNLEQCPKHDGVKKLKSFCALAAEMGYEWCWMDTCCIEKATSAELSEAINSMYRWYQLAHVCIAYLVDVHEELDSPKFETELRNSNWFTRCWTLQELLAPRSDHFHFYNTPWKRLASRKDLSQLVSDITGVDEPVFQGAPLSEYSLAGRMAWAAHRTATRDEDQTYSLMGIFDVNMAMLYGEGGSRAFERLCETIIQYSTDETIFAWSADIDFPHETSGLLAPSPRYYRDCRGLKPTNLFPRDDAFSLSSRGLTSTLVARNEWRNIYLVFLNVAFVSKNSELHVAVYLERDGNDLTEYVRILSQRAFRKIFTASYMDLTNIELKPTKIYVRHRGHQKTHAVSFVYGVDLAELLPWSHFSQADPLAEPPADDDRSRQVYTINIPPECTVSGPPTSIYRPRDDPQGPLSPYISATVDITESAGCISG